MMEFAKFKPPFLHIVFLSQSESHTEYYFPWTAFVLHKNVNQPDASLWVLAKVAACVNPWLPLFNEIYCQSSLCTREMVLCPMLLFSSWAQQLNENCELLCPITFSAFIYQQYTFCTYYLTGTDFSKYTYLSIMVPFYHWTVYWMRLHLCELGLLHLHTLWKCSS